MSTRFDAIIIGGGHNGLTCAGYLGMAGLRTLVLERRPIVGGAAVSEEVVPGFTFSVFSYGISNLNLTVIHDLDLFKFGLEVRPLPDLFIPINDTQFLVFNKHARSTLEHISRFSKRDASRFPEFLAHMVEAGQFVRNLMLETPFDPARRDWRSFRRNASFLWKNRRLGDVFYQLIDMMSESADDYLSRWFESTYVKAIFAYWCGIGGFVGPRTPGSAALMMYYMMSEDQKDIPRGVVVGGMGQITQAMAKSIRRFGVEIRTDAAVNNVRIINDRTAGVTTADGTEYHAPIVISNANSKLLFEKLIGESYLPPGFLDEIRRFRTYASNFKINVACETPPRYSAFDKDMSGLPFVGYAHIGPSIEYLEGAYYEAKQGRFSSSPWLTTTVPSIVDPSVAPNGKHVVNVFGGHAPYDLHGTNWDAERDRLVECVMATINGYAPGFSNGVISVQVLTPPDIERINAMPHGHILHGDMTLDQMFFMRPVPHYADYRTPVAGLYQCGSSCHPGGGVTGLPGRNAAREVLRDLGKALPKRRL